MFGNGRIMRSHRLRNRQQCLICFGKINGSNAGVLQKTLGVAGLFVDCRKRAGEFFTLLTSALNTQLSLVQRRVRRLDLERTASHFRCMAFTSQFFDGCFDRGEFFLRSLQCFRGRIAFPHEVSDCFLGFDGIFKYRAFCFDFAERRKRLLTLGVGHHADAARFRFEVLESGVLAFIPFIDGLRDARIDFGAGDGFQCVGAFVFLGFQKDGEVALSQKRRARELMKG